MKKLNFIYLAVSAIFLASCGGGDSDPVTPPVDPVTPTVYTGEITEDVTWTSNNIYELDGRVTVTSGVTLTIEAGTVIKAQGGQDADASCLLVARGGMLMANGTATMPIIFTSIADNISNTHANYPGLANLNATQKGLWGGVIVLGNAPISASTSEVQIEGIPASDPNGLYGGSDAADNSGSLTYVQIRHGGTNIGEGNEINGLTLGGVGTGTTISHIEVLGNVDDGIEFFGGTVNASNLLVWGQGDDAFDVDQSYSGTITNVLGIADAESDHALEIDGPEGSMVAGFTLTNGTLMGYNPDGGEYADFRKEATGDISNLYFYNFSCSSDFEIDGGSSTADLTFANLEFNTTHLDTTCKDMWDEIVDDQTGNGTNFNASNVSTPTNAGANLAQFVGWSCANNAGAY